MPISISELLFSVAVVSVIGAFLAFLIEIANHYLADYGEQHIIINDEKDLTIIGGRPLLVTLMDEKIFIPSACGGKGTCAYCKVRIHDGAGPVLPTEIPYLSSEEIKNNVRLSCQVKVKNTLKIKIPEDLFRIREFQAKVAKIIDLTPEIKGITLDITDPEVGITFRSGQYVQLEIPKYRRTKAPEYRAYSIASSAADHHRLELVITKAEKGVVSTYVHDYLKPGDTLLFRGPYGDFFLRESDKPILLIGTGSGLAPLRSILYQIKSENIQRKTTLFFGDKTRENLFFLEELTGLEQKLNNFKFLPTLSRSTPKDHWQGETGRVTDLIEKYIAQDQPLEAYLCGSPEMVESCMALLREKGVPEKCIYFDKFE